MKQRMTRIKMQMCNFTVTRPLCCRNCGKILLSLGHYKYADEFFYFITICFSLFEHLCELLNILFLLNINDI